MLDYRKFPDLLRKAQKPHEKRLMDLMQLKVDKMKTYISRDLTPKQKEFIDLDKELIQAIENYMGVLHKLLGYALSELEKNALQGQANFNDKLAAEKMLNDYISKRTADGDI